MSIIVTTTSSGPYIATAQTTFPVTFQSAGDGEITVLLDGVVVSPALYTHNRSADGTGTVVFTAPVSGTVLISSNPLFTQPTSFNRYGAFYPDQINSPLDHAAARILWLKSRALRVSSGDLPEINLAGADGKVLGVVAGAIVPIDGVAGPTGANGIFSAPLTGWTLPIGPVTRAGYVTTTATTLDVAETLAALLIDLQGVGVLQTAGLLYRPETVFAVQFTSTNGQSLAQTHSGGMNFTLAQVYNSKAFPRFKATTTFADLVPAVATDLTLSGGTIARRDGEAPIFGQLSYNYLLANQLLDTSTEQRIGIDNGTGATFISQHIKGQTSYNSTLSALTAAKNYATSIGKTIYDVGEAWFQGESDTGATKAAYQATLQRLARDYADDRKAITFQIEDPALFTYITGSNSLTDGTRNGVARAQHQAAVDYFNDVVPSGHSAPSPVILATPMHHMAYQFDATGLHVGSEWANYMGAYVALAQYQCYVRKSALALNKRWPPIIPIEVVISGVDATITYQLRSPGTSLAFGVSDRPNGEGFTKQQNYGFAVWDGASLVAINDPVIIAANKIRVTLVSGSFGTGYRIGYALDRAADHHLFFKGGAGNVRDNFGLTTRNALLNMPMHNWMGPHDITIGAGSTWSIS